MSKRLKDKAALITGGASGIGRATSELFAKEGASQIALIDLDEEKLLEVKEELTASYEVDVLTLSMDVSKDKDWETAISKIEETFGKLDILVNAAGISGRSTFAEGDLEEWNEVIGINQTGTFLGMHYAYHLMEKNKKGSIINFSSIAGATGYFAAPYVASKWAVRGMTQTAAMEFADDGIRVNAILPGFTQTSLVEDASELVEEFEKITALERAGEADEIANIVLMLASDESSYVTGADISVDGGLNAGGGARKVAKNLDIL